MSYRTPNTKGFTLLEMIVAIGIFSILALGMLAALATSLNAGKKSKTARIGLDSAGFFLDDITYNLRFGGNYHCGSSGTITAPQDCTLSAANYLALAGPEGNTIVYRRTSGGAIERSDDGGGAWLTLTDPSISVSALRVMVHGASDPDETPRVLISISGTVRKGSDTKTDTSFNLQTTVAKRNAIPQ